jgi:peroxiredoxin Q/BCP
MKIGDRAPDFELPDQQSNRVGLSDLLSDGPAVLYFYIKAKTPG